MIKHSRTKNRAWHVNLADFSFRSGQTEAGEQTNSQQHYLYCCGMSGLLDVEPGLPINCERNSRRNLFDHTAYVPIPLPLVLRQ